MSKILLKFKAALLKEIPLDKEIVTIGRHPNNDIHIDNLAVSNFHAKISRETNQFHIEDLNSTNGTFVNKKRITKTALQSEDAITIGKHSLVFVSTETEDADRTVKMKKPMLDETMVLDTRKHKEMLDQTSDIRGAGKSEKIGGFTVINGSTDKPEYELTGRLTTIGKADTAGIRLKGLFAPKVAALVNRSKDGYVISPPGTGKKPILNGNPLNKRVELKDGDILEVAGAKLQFYLRD